MSYEPSNEERESLQRRLLEAYKTLNYIELEIAKGNRSPYLFQQRDEIKELISELEARLAGTTDRVSPAVENFSKGSRAYITGDLGEAIRYYGLTLRDDPHYPRAEEMRIMAETEAGLRESASAEITKYQDSSLTLLKYGNKLIMAGVLLLLVMIVILFLYFSWS